MARWFIRRNNSCTIKGDRKTKEGETFMKKVGLIGAYDKTDLILNLSKILTTLGKRVLMIDSTIAQKAKYVVPVINPTASYVTNFEEIDVAVGFHNLKEIENYLGTTELPYDILLVDADTIERIQEFELGKANQNFFVTSFDLYSLKKGLEILAGLPEPIPLTKVLYSLEILKEDDDYLNSLSLGLKVIWDEERIYFPLSNEDMAILMENQRVAKIKFKRLSTPYKDGLIYMVMKILDKTSEGNIRRAIKIIERGV